MKVQSCCQSLHQPREHVLVSPPSQHQQRNMFPLCKNQEQYLLVQTTSLIGQVQFFRTLQNSMADSASQEESDLSIVYPLHLNIPQAHPLLRSCPANTLHVAACGVKLVESHDKGA